MDRAFLKYYEDELAHVRGLATEFAAMHPTVARNLSLDIAPCPDPYVERLLEGVAFLAARTRLKLDVESARFVRGLLDALYPDLAAPAPAMSMVRLSPGPQVDTMLSGHVVKRGTRLVSRLREGLTTRAIYTTAQEVTLWPVAVTSAEYLQDKGALRAAGVSGAALAEAEAGIRLVITRTSPGLLSELALDCLDVHLGGRNNGAQLFDAVHGWGCAALCRPGKADAPFVRAGRPELVGIDDREGLLPRVRASFEGFRLLREYFLMPERFLYLRLAGLAPAVKTAKDGGMEVIVPLARPAPALTGIGPEDFELFVTPVVNLFERECNTVEIDPRTSAHVVHADRTRTRDFEIFRILRVEDAEREGEGARLVHLHSTEAGLSDALVYTTERRPRRPGEDELRRGQTRTSYAGDDVFVSVSRPPGHGGPPLRRLDIRALCTNRDLPILDDNPKLTLETGDPVRDVRLLQAFRRPRASLQGRLAEASGGDDRFDDLTWRWISQLALNHLSLAEAGAEAEPLRALLALYADRGDPAYTRFARAVTRVRSAPVIERLPHAGPMCFAHGTEITLDIDDGMFSGGSRLLLSAVLSRLLARHAAINSFVRTTAHLTQDQETVRWPMTPGTRALI
jgi:type VI secretion system protein ImpG